MSYPASVTFKHQEKSSRLWALLTLIPIKMILLIPHMVVLLILQIVASFLMLIGLFAVLFTGRYPKGIENFVVGVIRWTWRLMAYFTCMTDEYPPFSLKVEGSPADLSFDHQAKSSRLWALLTLVPVKMVLLIPHFFVLVVIELVAFVCMLLGVFAVLFTGKYPESFAKVITTFFRYAFQVGTYAMCLTDQYPPVSWKE